MQRTAILFLAGLLVLGWFGSEAYIGQQICVSSCIDLVGMPAWEQAVSVAVLPALLFIGGIWSWRTEKRLAAAKASAKPAPKKNPNETKGPEPPSSGANDKPSTP